LEVGILYWAEIEGQVYIFSILLLKERMTNFFNDKRIEAKNEKPYSYLF
jgi:hypothetical protein